MALFVETMVLLFLIPLILGLIVLFCGLALYESMRNTLPAFHRGAFRKSETRLLRILGGLLESEMANKLDAQIKYFTTHGKYWRFEGEEINGVELCEDRDKPLAENALYDFREDCSLAEMRFQLRHTEHTITFQATHGRLWGWRVSPPLPRSKKWTKVHIKEARLLEHPELALRGEGSKSDFPVETLEGLATSFTGRGS